ncbi:MAG: gamma carbonic anhydrase family protein [Rhizobiaceae bacterium]|nr:gamma carbonic anhydrase family protein [Rhizobiaceae bacterium]
MSIFELDGIRPKLPAEFSFIAMSAVVIGNVDIGEDVGIWFGAVLRGDNEPIRIGARSNIQENSIIHTDPGFPATIGQGCTIGHGALIHGCTIGDNSLVGMGAIVLNGAKIGKNCLIGAGALVVEGKEIPDNSLVVGSPAKTIRTLDDQAEIMLAKSADIYVANARRFAKGLKIID